MDIAVLLACFSGTDLAFCCCLNLDHRCGLSFCGSWVGLAEGHRGAVEMGGTDSVYLVNGQLEGEMEMCYSAMWLYTEQFSLQARYG